MDNTKNQLPRIGFVAAAGLGLLLVFVVKRKDIFHYYRGINHPFKRRRIEIIQTVDECQKVVYQLQKHCEKLNVLGFDCEWVTVGGTRRPTALLQLSSGDGLCALFRLCHMKQIPKSLRDLLEDDNIIKVGVAPQSDAQKLSHDYGVGVASTFDLRFLAVLTGRKPEGLAKMSKSVLGIELDKHWRLVCSNWEAKELSEKQIEYAANDALVAVEIFKKLSKYMISSNVWLRNVNLDTIRNKLEPFYEVKFTESFIVGTSMAKKIKNAPFSRGKNESGYTKKMQARSISTRPKGFYDNCLLEAPDGELLSTIDRRKAKWYLDQSLGVEILSEPLTVRLNFEPAGRAVGDVGKYYQIPKENQCVVCGEKETFIRKNVIPREYRKHFPEFMKSHISHDVLLLCPNCHQLSNISDLSVRQKLSKMCNAPITNDDKQNKEIPELRQVKSAARALINFKDRIPDDRKSILESQVLKHFKESEISNAMLLAASEINTRGNIDNYSHHGERVVSKFQTDFGGILELERIWREHFINTMQPKHLPSLWNVNHNANRFAHQKS